MSKNIEIKKETGKKNNTEQENADKSRTMMPAFNQLVSRFFSGRLQPFFSDWPEFSRTAFSDIQETDKAYVLTAEIPGIAKDAVNINVSGNLLSIRAEHKEESGDEDSGNYSRRSHSFHQSFTLPSNVDPDKIEAHCENGVLEVMLPKNESGQSKKIEIKSGQGSFLNSEKDAHQKNGKNKNH